MSDVKKRKNKGGSDSPAVKKDLPQSKATGAAAPAEAGTAASSATKKQPQPAKAAKAAVEAPYSDDEGDFMPEGPLIDDSDDDSSDAAKPFVPPPGLLESDQADDCMIFTAGGVGFFLCLLCATLLPRFGVASEMVMAGGMLTLMLYIVYLNFCPTCRKSGPASAPMDSITPFVVFVFTGCIGTMIGGMFGGVLANIQWE